MGTSFAAPLVSGLTALLLEDGVKPKHILTSIKGGAWPSPDTSVDRLVIDFPNTLSP